MDMDMDVDVDVDVDVGHVVSLGVTWDARLRVHPGGREDLLEVEGEDGQEVDDVHRRDDEAQRRV
eukprot:265240-Prymnesium_polylepis.1